MARGKKRREASKSSACYARCVRRTGKWRGKKATEYVKYKKKKLVIPDVYLISYVGDKKNKYLVLKKQYQEILKKGDRIITLSAT